MLGSLSPVFPLPDEAPLLTIRALPASSPLSSTQSCRRSEPCGTDGPWAPGCCLPAWPWPSWASMVSPKGIGCCPLIAASGAHGTWGWQRGQRSNSVGFFAWFSLGMLVSAIILHVFFCLAPEVLLLTLRLRERYHSLLECLSRSGTLLVMCSVCRIILTCVQTEQSPGRCLVPVNFHSERDWIYTLELH